MTETLQEFCDQRGQTMRLDRTAGVLRGVKILGLESRNGRSYLPETLARAAALYEDAKVNVNHPKSVAGNPRDYQDRIGTIRGVTARPDGLFADFHFNPKHQLAEQLLWDAEHAPENVGFSHNVEARTARRGEKIVVEAITRVASVDLVADPATTRGLFESQPASTPAQHPAPATVDDLRRDYPELVEALAEQIRTPLEAELRRLRSIEAAAEKQQLARRLLGEAHLPDPDTADPRARSITSRRFMESLLAATDEKSMRALIEERAALVRELNAELLSPFSGKPISRDQYLVDDPSHLDARAFLDAIT